MKNYLGSVAFLLTFGLLCFFGWHYFYDEQKEIVREVVVKVPVSLPSQTIYIKGKPYPVHDTIYFQRSTDSLLSVVTNKDSLIDELCKPFGDKGENDTLSWIGVASAAPFNKFIEMTFQYKPFTIDTTLRDTIKVDTEISYWWYLATLFLGYLLGRNL